MPFNLEQDRKPRREGERIPVIFIGDSPSLMTGLSRIARDLATLLKKDLPDLVDLSFIGHEWKEAKDGNGLERFGFQVHELRDRENWGEGDVARLAHKLKKRGVLFSVWDASRLCGVMDGLPGNIDPWGYFAIDSENFHGKISGPASEVLKRWKRPLAYGRYGAKVMEATLGHEVQWLPHGLHPGWWKPPIAEFDNSVKEFVEGADLLIGCVATNTPRKDYGLLFQTLALMKNCAQKVRLWVHIDTQVDSAWSIPQLVGDFGLSDDIYVTQDLPDQALQGLYHACHATFAPGLGEGFGYPIVESLACGTPVVHVNFAGGAELIPRDEWLVDPVAWRLEGSYALRRPVIDPQDAEEALHAAATFKKEQPQLCKAYCRGSVAHLNWDVLWPRWRAWFEEGLRELDE